MKPKRSDCIISVKDYELSLVVRKRQYPNSERGGSRGRVQGVSTPPPSRDDPRLSNTTGILSKKKTLRFIGVEVKHERRLKNSF